MSQVQRWFERIAGITEEERRRTAFARAFFGQRGLDTTVLQTPACWRRSMSRRGARGTNVRGSEIFGEVRRDKYREGPI